MNKYLRRGTAALLGAILTVTAACPALAAAPEPTAEETLYISLDPYGAYKAGSVVKRYALNGASEITDYGSYSSVVNMSSSVQPKLSDGQVTFDLTGGTDRQFYFEGKYDALPLTLPWDVDVSYKLNGVPAEAASLAGTAGTVEITLSCTPNPNAGEYYRNNLVLEIGAIFDRDETLSIEAEGAQKQSYGSYTACAWMLLPGEEDSFTLRIGTEDFAFTGFFCSMSPLTLSAVNRINDLRDAKKDLEDSYDQLSDALDGVLDAMDGMSGSLNAAASGLDELNGARATISAGKGSVYDSLDTVLSDADGLAAVLDPVVQQTQDAADAITKSVEQANALTDTVLGLKEPLEALEGHLQRAESDADAAVELLDELAAMKDSLKRLKNQLNDIDEIDSVSSPFAGQDVKAIRENLPRVKALAAAWEAAGSEGTFEVFAREALWQQYAAENGLTEETPGYDQYREGFMAQGGRAAAAGLNAIYTAWSPDPEAFEFLLDHDEYLEDVLKSVNKATTSASDTINDLSAATASVVSDLQNLCDNFEELEPLIADAKASSKDLRGASELLRATLDDVDALRSVMNDYEPHALEALETLGALSVSLAQTVRDARALGIQAEDLARRSGTQLDQGTKDSLNGLASVLRKSTDGIERTEDVRDAKQAIDDLIDEKWKEYTGENNNLFLMDTDAPYPSFTSEKNPAPESISIVLRTEEIRADEDDETVEVDETFRASGSVLDRIASIFRRIWAAIQSIFGD